MKKPTKHPQDLFHATVAKKWTLEDFNHYAEIELPKPTPKYLAMADKFKGNFKQGHEDFINFRNTFASASMIAREGNVIKKEHARSATGDPMILLTTLFECKIYNLCILVGAFTKKSNAYTRMDKVCFADVIVERT